MCGFHFSFQFKLQTYLIRSTCTATLTTSLVSAAPLTKTSRRSTWSTLSTLTEEVCSNVTWNREIFHQRRTPSRSPTMATSSSDLEPTTLASGSSTVTSSSTSLSVWASSYKSVRKQIYLRFRRTSPHAETTYPLSHFTDLFLTLRVQNKIAQLMLTKCKFMFVLCDVSGGSEVLGSAAV